MNCTRCQGLMLDEHMLDMEGGYGERWAVSLRCVNCGHRDDAVIHHHRQLHAKSRVITPATVPAEEPLKPSWELESVEPLAA